MTQIGQLCRSAEQISNGEAGVSDPPEAQEAAAPSTMAAHIHKQQQGLSSKQSARLDKHQAALMREQAAGGGLGSLMGGVGDARALSSQRNKRPVRLGRLL